MQFSSRITLLRIQLTKAWWRFERSPRILITGCGRSGTNYVAKALSTIGLPFAHEGYPRKGIAAWPLAVKSEAAMPWWMLFKQGEIAFKPVLHQVRHPLKVITSTQTFAKSSWIYIQQCIPVNADDSLLLKCMKYWHYWNLEAEAMAEWTYRVETLPEIFEEFCARLGHPELAAKKNQFNQVVKTVNTRADRLKTDPSRISRDQVTWQRLESEDAALSEKIKLQAERYGYEDC